MRCTALSRGVKNKNLQAGVVKNIKFLFDVLHFSKEKINYLAQSLDKLSNSNLNKNCFS